MIMTNPQERAARERSPDPTSDFPIPPAVRGGIKVSALIQNGTPFTRNGVGCTPLKATVTIGPQTREVDAILNGTEVIVYGLIGRYPTGKPRKAWVFIDRRTGRQDVMGGISTGSSSSNNRMAIVGFEPDSP